MLLVIPAIELRNGRSYRSISCGRKEVYSDDPVAMALLWRRENAKTLHLFDHDATIDGTEASYEGIERTVKAVEVPVQLVSRFRDVAECERWLGAGVYRLFIHDLILLDPEGVADLVRRYGASRICAGAISDGGHLSGTWREVEPIDLVEFGRRAASLGMCRVFFTDRNYEGVLRGPNFDEIARLGEGSGLRITAAGGVASVEHLWRLQGMASKGVDSVVVGRAFYENSFPCQELWRDVELCRKDAGCDWKEGVSTAPLENPSLRSPH